MCICVCVHTGVYMCVWGIFIGFMCVYVVCLCRDVYLGVSTSVVCVYVCVQMCIYIYLGVCGVCLLWSLMDVSLYMSVCGCVSVCLYCVSVCA